MRSYRLGIAEEVDNLEGTGQRKRSRLRGRRFVGILRAMRNAILAVTSVILFLTALESGSRVLGLGALPPVAHYIADWERQWDGDFYTLGPGPGVNRDGLRDVEHAVARTAGVPRVACLGDSVTFGYGLPREMAYPARLAALLAGRGGRSEVMNVSLPGWSTRQQRIAYHRIVRPYQPDVVLLGFCLNDVAELQNNLGRPPTLLVALYRGSSLMRALLRPQAHEIRRVEELFLVPEPERVEAGWALTLSELDALRAEVSSDGVRFGLIVFPFRFQLRPAAPEPLPQHRLRAWAEASGVPMVDPLPELRSLGPAAFLDYDHLSPRGAQLVAEQLVLSGVLGLEDEHAAVK